MRVPPEVLARRFFRWAIPCSALEAGIGKDLDHGLPGPGRLGRLAAHHKDEQEAQELLAPRRRPGGRGCGQPGWTGPMVSECTVGPAQCSVFHGTKSAAV
ncbi:hypothetical protein [Streptomyces vietnamensis]|uniref:hypothetical protein n=1 Tax=Streptomyces vietnamensis TaxID=362257 RepID=UPI00099CD6F2